jgi:hypothetical protein
MAGWNWGARDPRSRALHSCGPIVAALAGMGVGGAVGGVTGALVGMGIPEYEAKRYEGRLQKGGILMSVHCDTSEEIERAKDVLNHGWKVFDAKWKTLATIRISRPENVRAVQSSHAGSTQLPRKYF